ncbi:nuclear transport factor 2 family protein [Streptomyces longwoodensis]|uniref:nuclear transport factor 2 family protein n=1 Tax=Streptomyces longwoodensis TaxID=68231 RepID=UPI00379DA48F
MSETWEDAVRALREAVQALLRGDGSAYKELWSLRDDISMMNAYGGLLTGPEEVARGIDLAADQYTGWIPDYAEELLAAVSAGPIGYLVLRERVANLANDNAPPRFRRITLLFRQEGRRWRVFHHHSDPLHQPSGDLHLP